MKKFQGKVPFLPPMIFIGVLVILLPIFTLMTAERLKRQKNFFIQRLTEKALFMIQTFEAGTRTGMMTKQWGASRIQNMLYETAQQEDVMYLAIISDDGTVLAHSDAAAVGQKMVMPALPDKNNPLFHREIHTKGDAPVFEVIKEFKPVMSDKRRFGMHRRRHYPGASPEDPPKDWSRAYTHWDRKPEPPPVHYMIAGLSMEKEQIGRNHLIQRTVVSGVLFFVLGCVGIIALLSFQAFRSAKSSLERVQTFSDTVIHHMPAGLITFDASGKMTAMNKAAVSILGKNLEPGMPAWEKMIEKLDQGTGLMGHQVPFKNADGRPVVLDVTGSIIESDTRQVEGYLFLFRDLTQVLELEAKVQTHRRLAAIGKFAAGVAHEIRNPLSSIKGFATYFAKRLKENETDVQTAQIMINEVERINRSVTQLLEFSRPLEIENITVSLKSLLDHSLKLVQHDLEKKEIQASVALECRTDEIVTDAGRMNQVLLNLYINAIQAMEKGGQLSVTVLDGGKPDRVIIEIRDTGKGIPAENLDRIFDPYFTTRPDGTGLGLSIVHQIVEQLSGTIRAKNNDTGGAQFIIELPVRP